MFHKHKVPSPNTLFQVIKVRGAIPPLVPILATIETLTLACRSFGLFDTSIHLGNSRPLLFCLDFLGLTKETRYSKNYLLPFPFHRCLHSY